VPAAVGKPTTLTWSFPNIKERRPLLTSSPLVSTGGDGTVSMQSLKQCYRCDTPGGWRWLNLANLNRS
jgi:hypothetical protein